MPVKIWWNIRHFSDYEALEAFLKKEGCPDHRRHVAKRPIFLIKGELQWVDSLINELKQ